MPISFIIFGILIIYLLFYGQNIEYRKLYLYLLLSIMIGYFIDDIEICNGIIIDIFIMMPCIIFIILLSFKIDYKHWLYVSIFIGISITVYFFLNFIDIEYSTVLNPVLIFIFTVFIGSVFLNQNNIYIPYYILIYFLYDVTNIFYIKSSIKVVSVFSINTVTFILYSICITYILNRIFNFLKLCVFKEKTNG